MPGTNGLDVIRKLEGVLGPAVRIVAMTGHDDAVSALLAHDLNNGALVARPGSNQVLSSRRPR